MSMKDEFIAEKAKPTDDKIRFVLNDRGHVTHVEKRLDRRLHDVYRQLRAIRCTCLPSIIDIHLEETCLIVHEEYIRGRTLEQILREEGSMQDEALLRIAVDLCSALLVLHGRIPPIIHRDIKPANIMRHENGGYVLMDFDAARLYREDTNTDTTCIATVGYAAPEQYGLSQTDVRSDLFSLGATLYELKTGESYQVGAKCGGLLGKVIEKCTAFEPNKRFQSARQLMDRLEKLSPEKKEKNLLPAVIIGAAVIAAAVIALALPRKQEIPPVAEDPPVSAEVPDGKSTPVPTPAETPASSDSANTPKPTPSEAPVSTNIANTPKPAATETPQLYFAGTEDSYFDFYRAEMVAKDVEYLSERIQGGWVDMDSSYTLVIPFTGEPMTIQFEVINRIYSNYKEIAPAVPIGCMLTRMSVGADGEVTDDGIFTVRKPGVYFIDTLAQYGEQVGGPFKTMVIITENFSSYTECKCVPDWSAAKTAFAGANRYLGKDGEPLVYELRQDIVFDSRLCDAAVHKEVFNLEGHIEQAPEGADCGIKDDIYFYTNTPGEYILSGRQVVAGRYNMWDSRLILLEKE